MIDVMVSSVTRDLQKDREIILHRLVKYDLFNVIGADPFNNKSLPSSSFLVTQEMARTCNIYILILSSLYGFKLKNGKSATEVEFDAAYSNDPTKILVFLKEDGLVVEQDQKRFIEKVTNYYSGYWRTTYSNKVDLKNKLKSSISAWLKERASLNSSLNYFDHFIRIAKNIKPEPTANIYYKVTSSLIEIEYHSFGKIQIIQFSKKYIYKGFWDCIRSLQEQFEKWKKE